MDFANWMLVKGLFDAKHLDRLGGRVGDGLHYCELYPTLRLINADIFNVTMADETLCYQIVISD